MVSILSKIRNVTVLHLDVDFNMFQTFELGGQTQVCLKPGRLPPSVAKIIGRLPLRHLSIPPYRHLDSNTVTQIRWKNSSMITCYDYGYHKQGSDIGECKNLKYLNGRIEDGDLFISIVGNGLIGMSRVTQYVLFFNWQFAVRLEYIDLIGIENNNLIYSVISNFKNLKGIRVRGDLNVLKILERLPHLCHLEFHCTIPIEEDQAVSCFEAFGHRLKALKMNTMGRNLMRAVAFCPNLKYLQANPAFSVTDMEYVSQLSKLQVLSVTYIDKTMNVKKMVEFVNKLLSLRFFEVTYLQRDHRLSQIAMLKNLKLSFPILVVAVGQYLDNDPDLKNPIMRLAKLPLDF